MYDAPFDAPTVVGWSLVGSVLVLVVLRALRVEWRSARSLGKGAVDVGLDVLLALAAVALLGSLAFITLTTYGVDPW